MAIWRRTPTRRGDQSKMMSRGRGRRASTMVPGKWWSTCLRWRDDVSMAGPAAAARLVRLLVTCSTFDCLAALKHLGHVHGLALERERNDRPNRRAIFAERRREDEHIAILEDPGEVVGREFPN